MFWLNSTDSVLGLCPQCNVPCGNGTQRRDIICVQKAGSDFSAVRASECAGLDKPAVVRQCEMGECKPQWFTTEWSAVRKVPTGPRIHVGKGPDPAPADPAPPLPLFLPPQCSQSCGRGLQMREVRCLTEDKKHSADCRPDTKPEQEQICNVAPCGPQPSGLGGRTDRPGGFPLLQTHLSPPSPLPRPPTLPSVHR